MNLGKTDIKTLITGYIDGELNEQDKKTVTELLETSEEFKRLYHAEKALKDIIIERAKIENAPAELKYRIKRQILRQTGRPGFFELLSNLFEYRPIATSFSLALVLLFFILPHVANIDSSEHVQIKHLKGEVVCLDCDVFSKYITVPEHTKLTHRPGIRGEDGSIWTIIQDDEGNNVDFRFMRKKVELTGLAFNDLRYIKVEGYHLL